MIINQDNCTQPFDSVNYIPARFNNDPYVNNWMWVKSSETPSLPNMTNQSGKFIRANGLVPEWVDLNASMLVGAVGTVQNKSGVLSKAAVIFTDTFSVSTATPTINLSTYMGSYTNVRVISVTGLRISGTAANSPQVSLSSNVNNPSVSMVITQSNNSTVSLNPIINVNVLNGNPLVTVPDPSNVKVILTAVFW